MCGPCQAGAPKKAELCRAPWLTAGLEVINCLSLNGLFPRQMKLYP